MAANIWRRWSKWLRGEQRPVPYRKPRFRPAVEVLENRLAPATLTVNTNIDETNTSDATLSLREAIASVNAGSNQDLSASAQVNTTQPFGTNDTILFADNLTTISVTNGTIAITKNLSISGPRAANLEIHIGTPNTPPASFTGFTITGATTSVSISGLTITGGLGPNGGAINDTSTSGTLTLQNCILSGNEAFTGGGAVYDSSSGTLAISGCTFTGNSATHGGAVATTGTITITSSTFAQNSANYGGAIWCTGKVFDSGSTFSANSAANGGGAINAVTSASDDYFSGNTAGSSSVKGLGGAILAGSATTTNASFTDNQAEDGGEGGAVYAYTAETDTGSTFSNNTAGYAGGAIEIANSGGVASVSNDFFTGNSAGTATVYGLGGGIYAAANANVTTTNASFTNNQVLGSATNGGIGGAIDLASGNGVLTVNGGTFSGNQSANDGGAISTSSTGASQITGSSLTNNNGSSGGAIELGGTLTLTNCTLSNNTVGNFGGAIYVFFGNLTITGCTLSTNTAAFGGVILSQGGIVNCSSNTLSNNTATMEGGAVYNYSGGSYVITDCTLSANTAQHGGAIYNSAVLTVTNSTLSTNNANNTGYGGAIFNAIGGNLTVNACTLSNNSANSRGGAIFSGGLNAGNSSTLVVINSTLASNSAPLSGGAIVVASGSATNTNSATLDNCTISANVSEFGGGIDNYNNYSTVTVANDIIAGNMLNPVGFGVDFCGGANSLGHNLIGDGNTGGTFQTVWAASDQVGNYGTNPYYIDPLLAPLGNYGGSTQTMALLPGSPAIGGGVSTTLFPPTLVVPFSFASGGTTLPANTYYYEVTAFNAIGETAASTETNITTLSAGTVTVSWIPLAPGSVVSGYRIYRRTSSGGEQLIATVLGINMSQYLDSALGTPGAAPPANNSTMLPTDQRGQPRATSFGASIDIGAYQEQGFIIQKLGGDKQGTQINTAFPLPLQVRVLAKDGIDPVSGGAVTFTSDGLWPTKNSATIVGDRASLNATANAFAGTFTATASIPGSSSAPTFSLTVFAPSFADFPSVNPRPSASSLGSNWALVPDPTHTAPSFIIDGTGAAVANNTASGTLNTAMVSDFTPNDLTVSTDVKLATVAYQAYGGVLARMGSGFNQQAYVGLIEESGTSRYSWLAIAQSGQFQWFNNNFAGDVVNVTSITSSGYNNVRLDVYGTRLSLFVNGVLVSSETDTTLKTGGGVGIIDNGGVSSFQNFAIASGLSFTDNFIRLSPPTLGAAWSPDLGAWSENGTQMIASGGGLNVLSLASVNRSTVDVQATIASISGTGAGVVADWNGATQSGYELLMTGTQIALYKVTSGSPGVAPLATFATSATSGTLELVANGSTLSAFLNGQFLFTYTDNSNPFTYGSVGLASMGSASFSRFSVVGP
jgi:predicted outer membrane repeat protein